MLFAAVFLISGTGLVGISSDSRWTVYISQSLMQHGDTNLDEYYPLIQKDRAAVLCIDDSGKAIHEDCPGHWYGWYPIGGPVLTTPLIGAQVLILSALRLWTEKKHIIDPEIFWYLRADPLPSHRIVEIEAASFILALTACVVFAIARRFLPPIRAVLLAALFALGTSAFSTGGRAIWQHTPSVLLLAIIIWLLATAEDQPRLAGHSYGPRFFTDLTPVLAMFLIPYLENWERRSVALRTVFLLLAMVGCAIHLQAGWRWSVFD